MRTGAYISGAGHAGLFLWLLIGGLFVARDDLPEISITDISIISSDDFEALQPQSPETSDAPPALQAPVSEEEAPTVSEPLPVPEARPEPPQVLPEPEPEVVEDPVESPPVPAQPDVDTLGEEGAVTIGEDDNPVPEAAPVITDQVTEAPDENVALDDAAQDETAPAPDAEVVVEENTEQTAPEQTTTDIVTEAEEQPSSAPTQSKRPGRKPTPPAPEVVQDVETPGLQDLINETVNEVAENPDTANDNANPGGGTSSPITREEKGAFILGIQKCWNVGALGTDALAVSVVVAFNMDRDAKPNVGSIRMVASEGGTGDAVKRAYETARRAIIRCGAQGYGLPVEKYDQWQEVEVTFNASRKQIR